MESKVIRARIDRLDSINLKGQTDLIFNSFFSSVFPFNDDSLTNWLPDSYDLYFVSLP